MKLLKRTRSSRPKLLRGLTAKGTGYYYSKKPTQKRTDYVNSKVKTVVTEAVKSIRIKRK